jgi:hypothetical protein
MVSAGFLIVGAIFGSQGHTTAALIYFGLSVLGVYLIHDTWAQEE